MGVKELAWFGGFERVICRANMTEVTISVYRLSSGFWGGGRSGLNTGMGRASRAAEETGRKGNKEGLH